jgi:uncharacterized protein (DUF1697 family)
VNVGGKAMINMAALKQTFESLGLTRVRTYINSGNVVFQSDDRDIPSLQQRIEAAIEQQHNLPVKVLLRTKDDISQLIEAIPADWMNDQSLRCYVLFLWPDIDRPAILDDIPVHEGVEEIRYHPGAVVQMCARKDASKSHLTRIIGTPLYARLTMRGSNTVRKLLELMERAV